MVARCPQRVHSSRCPPRAAVRHRRMARSTLTCFQRIQRRLRSMNAVPAMRMRSATSSGGRLIYSFRLFVFQLQRIQRTRGRMEVAIGKMQVHGGLFQIIMA